MSSSNRRLQFLSSFAAILATLAAAGCGNGQPDYVSYAQPTALAERPAPPAAPSIAQVDPIQPAADDQDPLITPDPLAGGASDKFADPLIIQDDPLASTSDPKMPTDHSHWLTGQIFNARVNISLNGILLGQYTGVLDKDITMKLHSGVNTVTFKYHPENRSALARLNLLESEHTPPIPPLATFRSPNASPSLTDQMVDINQTTSFVAH